MPSGIMCSFSGVSYLVWMENGRGTWPAMKKQTTRSLAQHLGSGLAVGSILWLSVTFLNGMHFSSPFLPPFLPYSTYISWSSWLILNAAHQLLTILLLGPPTSLLSKKLMCVRSWIMLLNDTNLILA